MTGGGATGIGAASGGATGCGAASGGACGPVALSGVLAIVLGIVFLRNPAIGLFTTAIWIGAGALAYGVLQIFAGFRFRKHKPLEA